MTADYQSILHQQASAGLAESSSDTHYLIPLPSYGVITVSGEEATGFLQNLLTNDVNQLTQQTCQISAMCNPKGRLLALFLLIKTQESYQLVLPRSQCAFLAQRLQMFKLRSKVEVADSSEQLSVCALLGNAPVDHAIPLTVPSSALLIHSAEQMGSRIEILLDQEWQLAAEASWHISEIEAGIPLIVPESRELFTAQQVNLDLIGGVSFRKGCYPGQEVVARLHYLGEPKRRLFHAVANKADIPAVGETVNDKEGAVVGHIVRAVHGHDDQLLLQLSLKLEGAEQQLFLNDGTLLEQVQASAPAREGLL
ncbi:MULTISPECIES: hypothetical protein [unclassified Methylophaga]|jgi:folate-binding protein YgfZ|uniref:CAF17-like 4Fe-4S cluster assembly/insertion protein YgfZ n=1 Tax=unclassified Methylophaga TaxID=2629249 RepID=UPI000C8FB861|nr:MULTISPECIES: hypothetical protein [unclassified Methylophaga]MAK67253.1 hypothetical protein [Methylophaga sp.]MAY18290.1 hypothetical protein [Methylophaga sp.]|tara:strand:- start:4954 stop:5883 length:930 start_codon:yes stop_codon:yes gene_type:complete